MQRLTDQVAIVTGAARGIGRGIASVLAVEGARVVIADVDGALAEATAALRTDGRRRSQSRRRHRSGLGRGDGRPRRSRARAGSTSWRPTPAIYPSAALAAIDDALWDRVHGHQREGRAPRHPGLPADDACARVRADRAHLVDHRAGHRPARLRALRRLEGGHARLHALCGGRAGDERRHGQRGPARATSRRQGFADTSDEHQRHMLLVDPDGPLRRRPKTSAGPCASSPRPRRATSPVRR